MGLGALISCLCSPDGLRGRAPPVRTEIEAPTLHPFGLVQKWLGGGQSACVVPCEWTAYCTPSRGVAKENAAAGGKGNPIPSTRASTVWKCLAVPDMTVVGLWCGRGDLGKEESAGQVHGDAGSGWLKEGK